MKMNNLEKNILKEFFLDQHIEMPNELISKINIKEREYTGVGFFTRFDKSEFLKVDSYFQRVWDKLGARLNGSLETGYIVYAENNYVTCIEGYTYGENWPSEVNNFELYKLP